MFWLYISWLKVATHQLYRFAALVHQETVFIRTVEGAHATQDTVVSVGLIEHGLKSGASLGGMAMHTITRSLGPLVYARRTLANFDRAKMSGMWSDASVMIQTASS